MSENALQRDARVTGATEGIGRCAEKLRRDGFTTAVIASSRRAEREFLGLPSTC